jgi:hypothetical protein
LRFVAVCLFSVILVIPAGAARALPASIGPWNSTESRQVQPAALETIAAGDAPILREYGILSAEHALYQNGSRQLSVTLYHMRDSSAAYGAYTFLRTADMATSDLAEKSAVGRDRVLVVEGNLLLDVSGPGTASISDLKALVAKIAPAADMAPYPTIWEGLPSQGLIPNSDHYLLGPAALTRLWPTAATQPNPAPNHAPDQALPADPPPEGDWLGFSDGAEAEIARYRLHGEIVSLLLVRYPTRQMATKYLAGLAKIFDINPAAGVVPASSDQRSALFVVRKSGLLAIVAGTSSQPLAIDLIRGVQYETSLTWSEPPWKATEKPFVLLLYDVFVGTGVILIYGAVASLAFGLVRLMIKRAFPNQVFDRASQIEVLQLGIYSKPIEAKDFYSDERTR